MNLKKLSDNDLLNVYLSGNENAVTVLVNRHRRRVFDYINMMVKDRDLADDIFQETLIKVIRFVNDGRYTENGKFLSQNHISEGEAGYDLLNNRKLSDSTVEDRMISDQIAEDVRKLVDFLPAEQKEVVLMRYYMGLSFKEIADETNVSINTALGRMRYALINMRKMIDEKQLILS